MRVTRTRSVARRPTHDSRMVLHLGIAVAAGDAAEPVEDERVGIGEDERVAVRGCVRHRDVRERGDAVAGEIGGLLRPAIQCLHRAVVAQRLLDEALFVAWRERYEEVREHG